MTSVAVLIPVLRRPHRVQPLLHSLDGSLAAHPRVWVLFVPDGDDEEERAAIDEAGEQVLCTEAGATYAEKINLAYHNTTAEWLFTGADDLRFHPGWLDYALWVAQETDAGVVGTNDLCNDRTMRGQHSTHSLVRRSYLDDVGGVVDEGPGSFMCEQYRHDAADDELVQTAMHRGVYAHAFGAIVEHLHPMCGKGEDDSTYELGVERGGRGQGLAILRKRAQLWGGDRSEGLRRPRARRREFRR